METNLTILCLKYGDVIKTYSREYNVSLRETMDMFYKSGVYQMMSSGIADYHCRSDLYLAEDLHNEWLEKQQKQTEKK